ncbi:STAS domain-containing protein [Streptomyces sp. MN13]
MPESEDRPSTAVGSPGLMIETYPDDSRVLVAVSGELGLDVDAELRAALRAALAAADEAVELDMSGVAFWDCSALNVLLALREQALAEGKGVAVRAASPIVERLLTLTGTLPLFTPDAGDTGDTGVGRRLGAEVVQLRRAMQTRPTIDLARGVLMASFGLSRQDAWEVLVAVSQRTNTKLHRLADDLVEAVQGGPLSEQVRHEVAAAVARLSASRGREAD